MKFKFVNHTEITQRNVNFKRRHNLKFLLSISTGPKLTCLNTITHRHLLPRMSKKGHRMIKWTFFKLYFIRIQSLVLKSFLFLVCLNTETRLNDALRVAWILKTSWVLFAILFIKTQFEMFNRNTSRFLQRTWCQRDSSALWNLAGRQVCLKWAWSLRWI